MDLVGMGVKDKRAETEVTVLRRKQGWTPQDVSKINALGVMVNGHPQHPTVLITLPWLNKETIEGAVGFSDFDHETVTGLDNPDLPFAAPSLV